MDFQAIRKEYESDGLDEAQLVADPIEQFRIWLDAATKDSPGRWFETNAMALSTTDLHGNVSARMVLLKGISDEGFTFFTNYDSQKGQQLQANGKASLLFHWPYQGRQIRIEGTVTMTERQASVEYFHSRPKGSQVGAAISAQSSGVDSRSVLELAAKKLTDQLGDNEVPCPENWGGYLVTPTCIEFWQGRLDRLHDRVVYSHSGESDWQVSRLSP